MFKSGSQLDRAINHAIAEVSRVGSPEKLSVPVRTVLLVHAAQGIIDNGGLQYFFEADFPDKPPYSIFVEAYQAIGATSEAAALATAVDLFPFANPHKHKSRRNKFLDQWRNKPDNPLEPFTDRLCGNMKIWKLLKSYVTRNKPAFPMNGVGK